MLANAGMASAHGSPASAGAATGYLPRPLTAAEIQHAKAKEAAVAAWMKEQHANANSPSPYCVTGPYGCVYYHGVSGEGEYTQEPWDQPNWCGAGSGTSVAMHWNYSWVVNYGSYSVKRDPDFGSGTESYSGGQGWMAWFAQGIWISQDNRNGVVAFPYENGTNIYWLKDGLNDALNTGGYYIVHQSTSTNDMMGNVEYDISHDNHPMIYLANAQYLTNWAGFTNGQLNHFVEGYAYAVYSSGNNDVDPVYYADTASSSDGSGIAGDWNESFNMMYKAVSTSDGSGEIVV